MSDEVIGTRLEKMVENAKFKMMARAAMIFASTVVLPVAGYAATEVWSFVRDELKSISQSMRDIDKRLVSAEVTFRRLDDKIDVNQKEVERRFDAQSSWMRRRDDELDKLKEKVWTR